MGIERKDYSSMSPEVLQEELKDIFASIPRISEQEIAGVVLSEQDLEVIRKETDTILGMIFGNSEVDLSSPIGFGEDMLDKGRNFVERFHRETLTYQKARENRSMAPGMMNFVINLENILEASPSTDSFKRFFIDLSRQDYMKLGDFSGWLFRLGLNVFDREDLMQLEMKALSLLHGVEIPFVRLSAGVGDIPSMSDVEIKNIGKPNERLSLFHELSLTWPQEYFERYVGVLGE